LRGGAGFADETRSSERAEGVIDPDAGMMVSRTAGDFVRLSSLLCPCGDPIGGIAVAFRKGEAAGPIYSLVFFDMFSV
jgi:hypothetical protein